MSNVLLLCNLNATYKKMSKTKRVMVSFTENQWALIEKLRGEFGDGDADIVRNLALAWLSEKSFISDTVKNKKNFKER